MPGWYVPWLVLLATLLGDAPTWRGYRDRAKPSKGDRSTIWVNTVLGTAGFVVALGLAPWLREVPALRLSPLLAWSGLVVAAAGIGLRLWAILTLGRFFTLTLQARADQPVIDRGPYRLIRHPSYLGGDLALLGAGLTCGNVVSALAMVSPFFLAHLWRIPIEEKLLVETLGEAYRAYMARTWRFIPLVW